MPVRLPLKWPKRQDSCAQRLGRGAALEQDAPGPRPGRRGRRRICSASAPARPCGGKMSWKRRMRSRCGAPRLSKAMEYVRQPEPPRRVERQRVGAVRLLAAQVDQGADAVAARQPRQPAGRGVVGAVEPAGDRPRRNCPRPGGRRRGRRSRLSAQAATRSASRPSPRSGSARGQPSRSSICSLISPIALAGFRPLGQVWVQFMMVWQRYSLNGSFSASSRSPVASSRLSAIQR